MTDSAAEAQPPPDGAPVASSDADGGPGPEGEDPPDRGAGHKPDGERGDSRVRALGVAVGLSIGGPVIAILAVFLVGMGLHLTGVSLTPIQRIVVTVLLMTGVGLGGVATLYLRQRPTLLAIRVPTFRDWLTSLVGFGMMFGLILLAGPVIEYLRRTTGVQTAENNVVEQASTNPEILIPLIPLSLLVIGPGEELLFRGAVQGRLREAFEPPAAIAIASALFAGIHFVALVGPNSGRLLSIAILFLPATVLGAAYEYSDNLVVPSLMHGAYNAVIFGLLYLYFTGQIPAESGGDGIQTLLTALLQIV